MGYIIKKIAMKIGEAAGKIDASNALEQLNANEIIGIIKDIIL
ncbi:hypothetical protein [Paenibacillus gallinarum]|nr:hypothetical protein [Paenibacillus gallinarum]